MISRLRIDHHAPRKSALVRALTNALAPLADRPEVSNWWLQRHWKFGPHLLVMLETSSKPLPETLSMMEHAARAALRECPSDTSVNPEQWMITSAALGHNELVEGPYGPVREDNTISWVTDGALDTFIRDDATLEVKGRLIAAGLPIVVATSAWEDSFRTSVLAGMMTLANAYPDGGITRGYLAFLSHWKEFLHWLPAGADIEASWSAAYEEQRDSLDVLLESVSLPHDQPGAEAQQWREWVRDAAEPSRDLARRGLVLPYPHAARLELAKGMSEDLGRRWGGSDDRSYSDFHVQFRKLDFTRLGDSDAFSAYRFTINCFFDLVTLMDVSPLERYALAYFLTRAVEDHSGTTWSEIVARGVARQALDPDARPTLPWRG